MKYRITINYKGFENTETKDFSSYRQAVGYSERKRKLYGKGTSVDIQKVPSKSKTKRRKNG